MKHDENSDTLKTTTLRSLLFQLSPHHYCQAEKDVEKPCR